MEEEIVQKKVKKEKRKRSDKATNIIFDGLAVICIIIIAIAITPKALQNDTFYNIKCGEYILKNGIFHLNKDPFSWHNLPYTWPHWLYDLLTYVVYHIAGSHWGLGFYIVTTALTAVLGMALYKTSLKLTKNNKVVSLIATLFAIYLMKPYIAARAQLVTFILFVLEIYFIEKLLETDKKRYGFALLLIALLIVELHCAVFPMFFVFSAPYVAEFVFLWLQDLDLDERVFRGILRILKRFSLSDTKKARYTELIEKSKKNVEARKIKREKRRKNPYKVVIARNKAQTTLIIFLLIAGFLGFLNPAGTGAYTYTLRIYQGNTTNSINEHLPLTLIDNKGYSIMLAITLTILVLVDIKVRLSDLLMFAGTLYLSLKSRRQVSLELIMGMPILAKFIASFFEKYDDKLCKILKDLATTIVGMILVVTCVTLIGNDLYQEKKDEQYVEPTSYPVEATKFLYQYMEENNIALEDLHLYNEYNYGSYLLLQGIPVFIDSRCDLYTPEFNGNQDIFTDALAVPSLNSNYQEIFDRYDVRHVILYSNDDVNHNLHQDAGYQELYNDGSFTIYKRVENENGIEEDF
ncbi:MAG: hypothetical protein IJ867_04575 [Clostridia bacterium]|nr:hypothetical protein [Clostridia bacterium]